MSKNRLSESKEIVKDLNDQIHDFVRDSLFEGITDCIKAMPIDIFNKLKKEINRDDTRAVAVYSAITCVVCQRLLKDNKIIIKNKDKE